MTTPTQPLPIPENPKKKGELWDSPRSGGAVWDVVVGPSSLSKELKGQSGLCVPRENVIYINTDHTAAAAMARVRFHEEFHKIGYNTGRAAIAAYLEISMSDMLALEELLNETYGAGLFAYLSDNGYLRYPEAPSGK